MVDIKLALISLPVCKLFDDCEKWVSVWQECKRGFVTLWFWFYENVKRVKNDCLYNTLELGRDLLLFWEISKATDTKHACPEYDSKMAVYSFCKITVILLWYVENNS